LHQIQVLLIYLRKEGIIIIKSVKYKDHTYIIEYTYTTRKDLLGEIIEHELILKKVNNKKVSDVKHTWMDSVHRRNSVIKETYEFIKKYIEGVTQTKFSYINEFENWDGNLDEWDE